MSHYAFPLNTSPHKQEFAYWRDGFTNEELKRVIALGESFPKEEAEVGSGKDPDYRACTISWIPANDDTRWLFEKVGCIVRELNRDYFMFDLWGFSDFQYTIYNGNPRREFYDWHIDTMGAGNHQQRKLSLVLQLDEPMDYEGGELWLHGKTKMCVPKEKGHMICFPSYTLHRVTPVTSGLRRSLVAWVLGPEFR